MLRTSLLIVALLLCLSFHSRAQNLPGIGVGAEFGLPSGNFTNLSAIGLGVTVKADFPISNNMAIIVNGGFMNFFGKRNRLINVPDLTYLPAKTGLKYYLSEGFYAEAQAGAAFPLNDGQRTVFVWSPGLGNQFKLQGKNKLDLGIRYEAWMGKNDTSVVLQNSTNTKGFVGLRFAYIFVL